MKIEVKNGKSYTNIDNLKLWDKNPRSISDSGFSRLKKQIVKLGMYKPLIVTDDGIVLGGNMRLRAYRELNITEVWISVVDAPTDEKKLEYALSDNDRAGFYDDDLLANLTGEMPEFSWGDYNVDLKEPINMGDLLDSFKEVVEDEVSEMSNEPAVSKLGEVYKLSRHRLMCGDSTKSIQVEKLMDGKKSDILITDPPYGVNICKSGGYGKGVLAKAKKYDTIIGDDKDFDPSFLLNYGNSQIIFGGNYFANKLPNSHKWLVWDKKRPEGTTFSDCELAWTSFDGTIQKYSYLWHGMIQEGKKEKREHPTQKPVGLMTNITKDFTKEDDIVLDLFLGSGSTLIACEQTNRICYGMEIDPKYCDVIRKRYWKFIKGKEEDWQNGTPKI